MKKTILGLMATSLLMLASCNLPSFNSDEEDSEMSYSYEEFEEPSIEKLNKNYGGFEVVYRHSNSGQIVRCGGKGNYYWFARSSENAEGTLTVDSATLTTVEGTSFKNEIYSAGVKWESSDTENNSAAMIMDTYYLGYLQHGGVLEDMSFTNETILGEAAKKYRTAVFDIYVSNIYGITIQVDTQDDDCIKFVEIKKGEAVEPLVIEGAE